MSPDSSTSRGRWLLRRLRESRLGFALLLLVGSVASGVFWLMSLSNALLGTGGLGLLIGQGTDDVRLTLGHAYSPWPGRVVFRDLHLEIHDSAVHFDLEIPRGDLQVDLLALAERRFEAHDLQAEGAKLQMRLAPAYRGPRREARLPDLSAPKAPSGTTRPSDLWGVALGIKRLELQEVWVDDARLEGELKVQGAFDLQPLDAFELFTTEVSVSATDVWLGDRRLSERLQGKLQLEVPRTSVSGSAAPRLLEQAVVNVDLATQVKRLERLNLYLPDRVGLGGGEGELTVEGGLRNLELDEATRLSYRSPSLELRVAELSLTAPSEFVIERRTSTFSTWTLTDLAVARQQTGRAVGGIDRLELNVETRGPLHRLTIHRGDLSLRRLAIAELRAVRPSLPTALRSLEGALEGNGEAHYEGARVSAKTDVRISGLELATDRLSVSADAWFSASASASAPFDDLAFSRLNLDLRDVKLTNGPRRSGSFDAALRATEYQLAWKTLHGSGPMQLKFSDTQPLETAADFDAPDTAKSLFGLRGLDLVVQTNLSSKLQDVRIVRGKSGSARIDGRLLRRGDDARLVLLVSRGVLSVGIAAWRGDSSVVPLAGDDWLQRQLSRI